MAKETKKTKTTAAAEPEYAGATDKLRDEMAKANSRYVQVVGEYLTDYLQRHPEAEAAILAKGKSIQGSMNAMVAEASKRKQGNVAVLDDRTAFEIVLKYFGIEKAEAAPETVTVETVPEAEPDPFDLDALMGGGM